MKIQIIKEAVSKFLEKDYKVLELFYKIPGDYEFSKEQWEKFNLIPDFLLKNENELCLAFAITEMDKTEDILKFIKK